MANKATHSDTGITIAIVGVGPRGISVLERLGAGLEALPADQRPTIPITIELIDKFEVGAGAIWQTSQTRILCKNTLAGAVTLFTEPGSSVTQPVRTGPTIWEWVQLSRGDNPAVKKHISDLYHRFPTTPEVKAAFKQEFSETTIDSHPSRALYGAYLRWCFDVAIAQLPPTVTIRQHVAEVTNIAAVPGSTYDRLQLNDGTVLEANATVLATGWNQPALTPIEKQLAAAAAQSGLTWVQHGNPVEQAVERLPAGKPVLVRGLGMGFFDLMALVTIGRGGTFVPDESSASRLKYVATGAEPQLLVSSGRGYPYLPKSEYGNLPPAPKMYRSAGVLAGLPDQAALGSLDFAALVWPALARDAHESYYRTLAEQKPTALTGSLADIVAALDAADPGEFDEGLTRAVADFVPEAADRFSLAHHADRVGSTSLPPQEFTEWMAEQLTADLFEAEAAAASPVKNGLWELGASRKAVAMKFAGGRATPESRGLMAAYFTLAQQVGSGPPAFRSRQLLALIEAGLVQFVGKRPQLRLVPSSLVPSSSDETEAHFVLTSPSTEGHEFEATALADAWMYSPDIRQPGDALTLNLLQAGRLRPYQVPELAGDWAETGSPEVDPTTRRTITSRGSADPRLYVLGIPTYAQQADTTISPAPGTDSTMLQETDAAATSLLSLVTGQSK